MSAGEPFAQLPESLIFDVSVSSDALRLYAAMSRYADAEGLCYPGQETLAGRLQWTGRRVRRHLDELIPRGWVEVISRGYWHRSSLYRLPRMRTAASAYEPPVSGQQRPPTEPPMRTAASGVMRTAASAEREPVKREPEEASKLGDGFREDWAEMFPGYPSVGKSLSVAYLDMIRRYEADRELGRASLALFRDDPRHKAERHGWGIFLADFNDLSAKARIQAKEAADLRVFAANFTRPPTLPFGPLEVTKPLGSEYKLEPEGAYSQSQLHTVDNLGAGMLEVPAPTGHKTTRMRSLADINVAGQ